MPLPARWAHGAQTHERVKRAGSAARVPRTKHVGTAVRHNDVVACYRLRATLVSWPRRHRPDRLNCCNTCEHVCLATSTLPDNRRTNRGLRGRAHAGTRGVGRDVRANTVSDGPCPSKCVRGFATERRQGMCGFTAHDLGPHVGAHRRNAGATLLA